MNSQQAKILRYCLHYGASIPQAAKKLGFSIVDVHKFLQQNPQYRTGWQFQVSNNSVGGFLSRVQFQTQDEDEMLIPPGLYHAVILEVELKTSKAGFPMLQIEYQIEGPSGYAPFVTEYLSLQPHVMWKAKKLIEATGLKIGKDGYFNSDDLIGKSLTVQITHETWRTVSKQTIYNKVCAYFPEGSAPTPEEVATMTPLDLLKRAFPDQDVESLLKILGGAA